MNKEEPYRDQAERLRQRIEKINEKVEDSDQLPPREQIHRQKRQKTKWKLKYPVIRLLALCFILLPIIIFSVISYRDGNKKINGTEKTPGNSVGYETINLEKSKEDAENNSNKSNEAEEINQKDIELSNTEQSVEEPKADPVQPNTSNNPTTSDQSPSTTEGSGSVTGQETDKNSKASAATVKSQPNTVPNKSKIVYHTVQPQENLFQLAKKYYQSKRGIDIIKKANNLKSEDIKVGQVLKIPLNN